MTDTDNMQVISNILTEAPENTDSDTPSLAELVAALTKITTNIEEKRASIKSTQQDIKGLLVNQSGFRRKISAEIRRLGVKTIRKPKEKEKEK